MMHELSCQTAFANARCSKNKDREFWSSLCIRECFWSLVTDSVDRKIPLLSNHFGSLCVEGVGADIFVKHGRRSRPRQRNVCYAVILCTSELFPRALTMSRALSFKVVQCTVERLVMILAGKNVHPVTV